MNESKLRVGVKWTSEEEVLLRRLWRKGKDVEDIAEQIGRPTASIKQKASILGLLRNTRRIRTFKSAQKCHIEGADLHDYKLRSLGLQGLENHIKAVDREGGGTWSGKPIKCNGAGSNR